MAGGAADGVVSDFRQELLAAFEAEYREHLLVARAALAAGALGGDRLRDVFRRVHSLKGAARAVDLPRVEEIAHGLESRLNAVVEAGRPLDDAEAAALARGLDEIEAAVALEQAGSAGWPDEPPGLPDPAAPRDRQEAPTGEGLAGNGAGPARDDGAEAPSATVPATATEVPAAGDHPSPLRPDAPASSGERVPVAANLRVSDAEIEALGIRAHAVAAMLDRAGTGAVLADLAAELRGLLRDRRQSLSASGSLASGVAAEEDEKLSGFARRLDRLAREQGPLLRRAGLEAAALQDDAERLSLVPADSVLGGLDAVARALAREQGLEIVVRVEGLSLRARRGVLQALRDPAIQMLRNAVGHGLVPRAAGAAWTGGEIELALRQEGDRLVLTVSDNGSGPDLHRIEAAGRRTGLLATAPDAPPPTEAELLALPFSSGLSTARAADRLSGRGMGLSIVAEAARRLRGDASLLIRRDERGAPAGAVLRLSVPLGAARRTLLMVSAAGHRLALPAAAVSRLLRAAPASIEQANGRPVLRLPGRDGPELLPLGWLDVLLGGGGGERPSGRDLPVLVLQDGRRRAAVVVDALCEVDGFTMSTLPVPGLASDRIAGTVLAAGGRPVPVLDAGWLLQAVLDNAAPAPLAADGRTEGRGVVSRNERQQPTILVVDDSITTRTLERSILQAQGYRVLLAVDGVDALTVLRTTEREVDVVVADVEMPRLDGFGLLDAMQRDPRLRQVPVILMTSRGEAADVARGMELGARAYLTKQRFDQGALLEAIGQLLP
ncbi:response regulator [Rhizosaccharibacter radicis]|uniref:histidine kinase n=1 Tax=Rhizosaccharibacter radicis TaxID=2782605 RepID=A0ABT1VX77_9PROT|nr:response regulator [Acetobacteraceae bacterium KSS12]